MISVSLRLIREHNRFYKACLRLLWRFHGKMSPIVLMVHGFKSSKQECDSAFEATGESFMQLMEYMLHNGWKAMSWAELLEMVDNRTWGKKCFYVTFDDVYDTVYTKAFPVLKHWGIPFTLFVTAELVDKPGFITMEHLRELAKDELCTIGCHGLQHKVFRYLNHEEADEQYCKGKDWLKNNLGIKADSFAFPYGRIVEVSRSNRKQIQKTGFSLSFSALEGTLQDTWFTGRWFLPRVNMSEKFVERFINEEFPRFKDCEGR